MSLLFTDGYASAGVSTGPATAAPSGVMSRRYTTVSGTQQRRLRARGAGQAQYPCDGLAVTVSSSNATRIVGFEWINDEIAGGGITLQFRETSATGTHASLILSRQGYFEFWGPGAATLLGTGTTRIRVNRWYYIEVKIVVHQTLGSLELKLNGVTEISLTNLDTQNTAAFANYIHFIPQSPTGASKGLANVYILDGAGTVNNDFLGPCRIATLNPTSDGGTTDWTPSSGSDNYAMVDELSTASSDSDTSYVSAVTSGDRDLYGYSDLPASVDTIYGITGVVDVRVDSASPESICQVANSNGTVSVLPAKSITAQTYSRREDVLELDPDTSDLWTPSAVDALEFGFEID